MPLQYVLEGQPLVQRMGQSASVPLQTIDPPHAGLPGSFAGAGAQVPFEAARLQRSQLPAWQIGSVRVRVRLPVTAQVEPNVHEPYAP